MQKTTLKRFQHYLASQGRPWTQQDDARWQLLSTLYPASEEALLHGWVVQALNNQDLTLALGALWLMQYPAGQMVVASRWPQAPHATPGLLYPHWTQAQHMKNALGLPWYNGEV